MGGPVQSDRRLLFHCVLDASFRLGWSVVYSGLRLRGELRVLEELLFDLLGRIEGLLESGAVVGRTGSTKGAAATGA